MEDNKIITLAKKLHELAKRGVDGEKQNALDMLEKMMHKHGITWDMLDENKRKERVFKMRQEQKKFFIQVVGSVCGAGVSIYSYNANKRRIIKRYMVELTDMEFIEVQAKFDFYWTKYNEDMELFYSAFIQKNKLYPKPSEDDSDKYNTPLTLEEKQRIFKMLQMMDGLDRHTMQLRLTDKN